MATKLVLFTTISFLHNLFTAIWMGGMMVALIAYLPAVKEVLGPGPQSKKIMGRFQKKLRIWVYISIVMLIITGILMSRRSPDFAGWFSFATSYSAALSVKHIMVLVMIAISLYRSLVLTPKAPAMPQAGAVPGKGTPRPDKAAAGREKLSATLLLTNVVLAVLVLLNSAVVQALALRMPGK
jgi:uncharacterized membrane protein